MWPVMAAVLTAVVVLFCVTTVCVTTQCAWLFHVCLCSLLEPACALHHSAAVGALGIGNPIHLFSIDCEVEPVGHWHLSLCD